jgi:hypothetical protein
MSAVDLDRPQTNGTSSKEERPPSQADLLVALVLSKSELFHDGDDDPYLAITDAGVTQTWKLRSARAAAWLNRSFFELYGKVPGSQARNDALNTLEGIALNGPRVPVFVRTAEAEGRIHIDLGDDTREAVEVTPTGWRVVRKPPVRFIRPKGMLPLPRPVAGGSVSELRQFVNVADDAQFRLLVAWLVAAQRGRGPFPILCVQGEHGSAKSTCSRFVRHLCDPKKPALRGLPRDEQDLAVAARWAHLLAFDNLSGLPAWVSDALCRVSTGGGFATRSLYTNDEETIFDFVRPILLNGIDDVAARADLADRCVIVTLPAIPKASRQREKDLVARFEAAAPRLFGAVLTAVSMGLRREHDVSLPERPRMADFAEFIVAAEPALGWQPGDFIAAYSSNQREAVATAIDADLVAKVVVRFMATRDDWIGEPSELFDAFEKLASDRDRGQREWPKAANALSNRLRRLAPVLREAGIHVERGHEGRDDARRRTLRLQRLNPIASAPSVVARNDPRPVADTENHGVAPGTGTIAGTEPWNGAFPPNPVVFEAAMDGDDGDDPATASVGEEPPGHPRLVAYGDLSAFQRELVDLGVQLHGIQVVYEAGPRGAAVAEGTGSGPTPERGRR